MQKGADYEFVASEGTYRLQQDMNLVLPPPHPSDPPPLNPNPLSTAPIPVSAGTTAALISVHTHEPQSHSMTNGNADSWQQNGTHVAIPAALEPLYLARKSSTTSSTSNGASFPTTASPMKRKKPKNSMQKTNSSFVSRIIKHDKLEERMAARKPEDLCMIANRNRALEWIDMANPPFHEPLTKVLFTKAHPICQDINPLTRAMDHLDVIIGFNTGDSIWYDPIDAKYVRINKQSAITKSPVRHIKWIPGSEDLYIAAHQDGTMYVLDKNREDQTFVSSLSSGTSATPSTTAENGTVGSNSDDVDREIDAGLAQSGVVILKSLFAASTHVSPTKNEKKFNPLAGYQFSKSSITHFSFSPDNRHIAITSEDGTMRIMDLYREAIVDVYRSFFGGFTCTAWTPDGHYILTGGKDDLITIFSATERRIIARCEGHQSWVTAIEFDPWHCDDRTYRFGSVGEDCRLLLWDFSMSALHMPKSNVFHNYLEQQLQPQRVHENGLKPQSLHIPRLSQELKRSASKDHNNLLFHPTPSGNALPSLTPIMVYACLGLKCLF